MWSKGTALFLDPVEKPDLHPVFAFIRKPGHFLNTPHFKFFFTTDSEYGSQIRGTSSL